MIKKLAAVIGLGTALTLAVALGATPLHAAGWTMLPEDVIVAVHFDMESLAESELYKSLVEQYGSQFSNPGEKYLEFVEATGFDIERDLQSLTIGAGEPGPDADGAFYLVVKGRFDQEKIAAYAAQSGKVRTGTHGKLTTYVPLEMDLDGPPPVAAWTDDETMLVASTPDFPKLVSSVSGKGLSATNSALGKMLGGAQGQFYLAMEIPETKPNSGEPGNSTRGLGTFFSRLQNPAAGPMQNLETILVTLNARTGLDLALQASVDSAANGQLVYEMLNGYLMLGRSMAAQNPQAASILNHLELEHAGSSVAISVSMSGDDVRAAVAQSRATTGE